LEDEKPGEPQLPIRESLPDQPITFYDISKLTAEMYLKQYVREGWMKGCSLRFSNVFGRGNGGQQRDRGIVDKIYNLAVTGQKITIYGDGNYLRDYIFIDDVVSALSLAAKYIEKTNGLNFYIGSGQGVTLNEAFLKVISKAAEATGVCADYEYVPPPANLSAIEFRNAVIDSSAFRQATGWIPQFDFDAGLETAYQDFLLKSS
jgi:nucleoside-diphosphate-sugar epimerase